MLLGGGIGWVRGTSIMTVSLFLRVDKRWTQVMSQAMEQKMKQEQQYTRHTMGITMYRDTMKAAEEGWERRKNKMVFVDS